MSDDDFRRIATRILEQIGFKSGYGGKVCWFGHDTAVGTDEAIMRDSVRIIKEELGFVESSTITGIDIFAEAYRSTGNVLLSDWTDKLTRGER